MAANQGGIYSVLDDERINGRSDFFAGLGAGIDGSWALRLGTLVPSTSEVEDYKWLGNSPHMSVWEGEPLFQELPNYKAALRNIEYHAGMRVQKADIRRDKVGMIRPRMQELGQNTGTHWEELLSTLIINSETDGSKTIGGAADLSSQAFDGQAFFDTDHVYTGSNFTTAQSNDLSGGVYDIATATAPTAAEAAAIILDMVGNFYALKNDQGQPINGNARNFEIQVGTVALWAPFQQAVSDANLAQGQTNPVMGLLARGINITVTLNPRLSAKTNKVYMFCTDGRIRSFILQDEVPVNVEEEDPGITSKSIIVQATATRSAGFGLWTQAMLATLS